MPKILVAGNLDVAGTIMLNAGIINGDNWLFKRGPDKFIKDYFTLMSARYLGSHWAALHNSYYVCWEDISKVQWESTCVRGLTENEHRALYSEYLSEDRIIAMKKSVITNLPDYVIYAVPGNEKIVKIKDVGISIESSFVMFDYETTHITTFCEQLKANLIALETC